VTKDHPRIDLLRHLQLTLERDDGTDPVIHSPAFAEQVRDDWRQRRPFLDWLAAASPGVAPRRRGR